MRRAATSVPTNIAEGAGRPTRIDYARFLGLAASSLHELHYQTELCADLGLGDEVDGRAIRREAAELRAMLTALRVKVSPRSRRPDPD
jgi:four helix bundle protein